MVNVFTYGGLFQYVITVLGLVALGFSILQIIRKGKKDYAALIVGMTAATFLAAVLAYALGMYHTGRTIAGKGGNHATLAAIAEGISCTALIWGALLCTANVMVGSLACHLHRQAKTG